MRVLSIPAGGSFVLIDKYSIHAFPHPRSYDYAGLVTFRKKGGFMESLYHVENTVTVDFDSEKWSEEINYLDESIKVRIMDYIQERKSGIGFNEREYMFWVLKMDKKLVHEPRPIQNYNNHVYFNYDGLTSGQEIVAIDSKKVSFKEVMKNEFEEIGLKEIKNTEIDQIIKARIGQSLFKKGLLKIEVKCSICCVDAEEFLIGSHIKPWKDCTSKERLDINNGLLFCPSHDWLFDKGYITFDKDGYVLINYDKSEVMKSAMNINDGLKIEMKPQQKKYMAWHRENYFKK